jgi:hypothetical protein
MQRLPCQDYLITRQAVVLGRGLSQKYGLLLRSHPDPVGEE